MLKMSKLFPHLNISRGIETTHIAEIWGSFTVHTLYFRKSIDAMTTGTVLR